MQIENGKKQPPAGARLSWTIYPFSDMEIDQSVSVPLSDRVKLRGAANMYRRRHPGWAYRSATVIEDGKTLFRVWRVNKTP